MTPWDSQPLLDRGGSEIGELLTKSRLPGQPREQHLIELGAERAARDRILDAARFDPLAVIHLHDCIQRQKAILDLHVVRQHCDALNEIAQAARDRLQQCA